MSCELAGSGNVVFTSSEWFGTGNVSNFVEPLPGLFFQLNKHELCDDKYAARVVYAYPKLAQQLYYNTPILFETFLKSTPILTRNPRELHLNESKCRNLNAYSQNWDSRCKLSHYNANFDIITWTMELGSGVGRSAF